MREVNNMMKSQKNKKLYSNLKKQYEDQETINKVRRIDNELLKHDLKNNFLEQENNVLKKRHNFITHTRNK